VSIGQRENAKKRKKSHAPARVTQSMVNIAVIVVP